ncbi:substrate-binding domain-containing protein [Devosia naphthalenivorans]|uniref:LacI family DNA-binding transcriptional regulator n=1 Tax=Devosia naphthalenivorans TaxID=2082392 RepID=UPI000D38DFD5|nr:substrate-binding domain-containing protein [Devosia naphthalenivorans]
MEVRERSFVKAEEVAKLAGVSRSAVSRTFTDGASVSEVTRKKVLAAAEALGYHVNHLARGLSHERSNIVCLLVSDISTPYQARMIDIATQKLQSIGKIAMVINTTGEPEGVASAMRQTVNYRADAVIVLSGTPSPSLIATCLSNGQRVILINRDDQLSGPTNIVVENTFAATEAYHLLKRAGCARIAVVSSTAGTPSLKAREVAFVEAARQDGLDVPVMQTGPTGYATGMEAARRLFGRAVTPDGIFCVTDLLAMGCMDVARNEFGMSVPDELSIIGFDDIDQAAWMSYNLTTFRQPLDSIADHIVRLLAAETLPQAKSPTKSFQPIPVWRGSVRPRPPR